MVVSRRGVVYIYRGERLWYWFGEEALASVVQEVESQDKTRKEGVSWIGGCT